MPVRSTIPALPAHARRPAALIAALATAGLGLLAVRYAGVTGAGYVDAMIGTRIQEILAPYRNDLRRIIYVIGPRFVLVASVILALSSLATRRWLLALVAIAGPALTGAATTLLQPTIGRTLNGGFALPSGHTGGATAISIVLALLVLSLAGHRLRSAALVSGAGVLTVGATVATALVANDLHYLTDTVAGFCTAVAVVLGSALTVDALRSLRR